MKKELRRMDQFCHYALASATMAHEDSQLDLSKINLERAGVVLAAELVV